MKPYGLAIHGAIDGYIMLYSITKGDEYAALIISYGINTTNSFTITRYEDMLPSGVALSILVSHELVLVNIMYFSSFAHVLLIKYACDL